MHTNTAVHPYPPVIRSKAYRVYVKLPIRPHTNTAITWQLMRTARKLEAEWRQVLRGSVGMGAKEDEPPTGHVRAAGFHYVTACYRFARFETNEPFIYLIFIFFRPR
jgi:hypothetical protein